METTSSHRKTNKQRLIAAFLIFMIPLGLPGEDTIYASEEEETVHDLSPFPVVGTRIRGIDLEGTLPVVKLDSVAIEATGFTRMDEVIRSLPMVSGASVSGIPGIPDISGLNDGYD
jgi:hypothetical protein